MLDVFHEGTNTNTNGAAGKDWSFVVVVDTRLLLSFFPHHRAQIAGDGLRPWAGGFMALRRHAVAEDEQQPFCKRGRYGIVIKACKGPRHP